MSLVTQQPLNEEEVVGEIQASSRFTWTITNFSQQTNNKKLYSDTFVVDGYKWRVLIFPKGNNVDYLSIYLDVPDSSSLPNGWSRHAQFSFSVVNQTIKKSTITEGTKHDFRASESDWGFTTFMNVCDLYDLSKGFLMNDTCIIEADVTVLKTEVNTPSKKQIKPPAPEKVSSSQSDIICVQGYNVKNNIAPVLEAIFKKHGDIAAECVFKPASMRSSFLEVVCEVVGRIETSDFTTIVSEMEEIENQVSALEAVKVNVSWLRAHLEAIHKRKNAKKNSILLVETKGTTVLVKIAAQMDLKERSAELVDAQERFEKADRCVRVLDLVEKKLSNNIMEAKAERDSLVKQPIL